MNRIVCVTAAIVLLPLSVFAVSTVQIGDATVEGSQVIVPIILGGSAQAGVSALNFRLNYNAEILQPVSASPGAAARSADKRVMANVAVPGEYVVVMMGMNQTTCSAGEVVRVVLDRLSDSRGDDWGLGITGLTLSSTEGAVIDSEVLAQADESDKTPQTGRVDGSGAARVRRDKVLPSTEPGPVEAAGSNKAAVGSVVARSGLDSGVSDSGRSEESVRQRLESAIEETARARAGVEGAQKGALENPASEARVDESRVEVARADAVPESSVPMPKDVEQLNASQSIVTDRSSSASMPRSQDTGGDTSELPRGLMIGVVVCAVLAGVTYVTWRRRSL